MYLLNRHARYLAASKDHCKYHQQLGTANDPFAGGYFLIHKFPRHADKGLPGSCLCSSMHSQKNYVVLGSSWRGEMACRESCAAQLNSRGNRDGLRDSVSHSVY